MSEVFFLQSLLNTDSDSDAEKPFSVLWRDKKTCTIFLCKWQNVYMEWIFRPTRKYKVKRYNRCLWYYIQQYILTSLNAANSKVHSNSTIAFTQMRIIIVNKQTSVTSCEFYIDFFILFSLVIEIVVETIITHLKCIFNDDYGRRFVWVTKKIHFCKLSFYTFFFSLVWMYNGLVTVFCIHDMIPNLPANINQEEDKWIKYKF